MAQGKAAMTLEISIFAKMILENPKQSRVVGKLGYAVFPANTGAEPRIMLPLNMTFMSALSQKKEAAWLFMQFMNSKESHLTFQLLGLPSCRKSSWEHPEYKQKDTLPELSKIQLRGMQTGMTGYELPVAGFQEARPLLERTIYTAYEGGDVRKAADEAVKGVREIMSKTEK
jgi:ABC-type glycerol-3-phosphate transport system substrate-binding protein